MGIRQPAEDPILLLCLTLSLSEHRWPKTFQGGSPFAVSAPRSSSVLVGAPSGRLRLRGGGASQGKAWCEFILELGTPVAELGTPSRSGKGGKYVDSGGPITAPPPGRSNSMPANPRPIPITGAVELSALALVRAGSDSRR